MKAIFSLLLIFGLSFSAFAGNEGPQATPRDSGKLVAEALVAIFFAPPTYPRTIVHQIYSSGYTQVVKTMQDGKTTVQALKPYSTEEMRAIQANVQEIVPGAFFDPDPTRPGCTDAPTEKYKVFSSKGEIEIFKRMACKTKARKNANQADADMITILHDLVRSE